MKCNNIHTVGIPEGEERKGGRRFEEIAKTFPNLGKDTEIQIQEGARAPNKISPRRSMLRHMLVKM